MVWSSDDHYQYLSQSEIPFPRRNSNLTSSDCSGSNKMYVATLSYQMYWKFVEVANIVQLSMVLG